DDGPALAWLDELIADGFHWVVLFTGEGVRRLLACAERHGKREAAIAAFGRARSMTRGPKPGRAFQEVGLKPTRVALVPTTEGVIASMDSDPLDGLTVGVQLYREDNPAFIEFLTRKGATARTVLPYVYAPASDAERVLELIGRLDQGTIDAVVFTSAPQ